jgi:hypothetical protein
MRYYLIILFTRSNVALEERVYIIVLRLNRITCSYCLIFSYNTV